MHSSHDTHTNAPPSNPLDAAGPAGHAAAATDLAPTHEPSPPADKREVALTILAAIAVIFALQWAEDFFIPLVFGIFIAYTLNPIVAWLATSSGSCSRSPGSPRGTSRPSAR